MPGPICRGSEKLAISSRDPSECRGSITGRTEAAVAGAVRTLKLTVADALYAYGVTGSAFATLSVLAAPHLEVCVGCFFDGTG